MTTHQITHPNINTKSNGSCCVPATKKKYVDYYLLQGQCSQALKGVNPIKVNIKIMGKQ